MKRVNTSDIIYNQIKSDFINNKIDFGQKINELELAQEFNVSRTPLREAIKKLEIEGLVVRQVNGRLKIVEITREQLEELYRVRLALENMLLEHASTDEKFMNKLKNNIEVSQKLIDESNYDTARVEIAKFTNIIYTHITLDITKNLLKSYSVLISKIKNNTLNSNSRTAKALEEHKKIFDALTSGDINLACELNTSHLQGACDEIISQFFE